MKTTVRTNIDMLVNTLRKISYEIADNAAVQPSKVEDKPADKHSSKKGARL